jgi:hypothetical protein
MFQSHWGMRKSGRSMSILHSGGMSYGSSHRHKVAKGMTLVTRSCVAHYQQGSEYHNLQKQLNSVQIA